MAHNDNFSTVAYAFSSLYAGIGIGLLAVPVTILRFYTPAPLDTFHSAIARCAGLDALMSSALLCSAASTADPKTRRIAAQSAFIVSALKTGYWVYSATQNRSWGIDRWSNGALAVEIALSVSGLIGFGYYAFCPVSDPHKRY